MSAFAGIDSEIIWSTELRPNTDGIVVVIDVLAATTNMMDFFEHGARIFLTSRSQIITHHQNLKGHGEVLLVGEADSKTTAAMAANGLKFAASNSPIHIRASSFLDKINGKTLLYLSNNGTRVINLAFENGASRVLTANFLNLYNVAEYLLGNACRGIKVVPSGEIQFEGEFKQGEDMDCALALQTILKLGLPDLSKMRANAKDYIVDKYRSHGLSVAELEQHAHLALYRPRVLEALRHSNGLIELVPAL